MILFHQPEPAPFIIDIREPASNDVQDVINVLVGSFGIAGLLFLGSIVVGAAFAFFLFWRRSRYDNPVGGR
jgi:hypothetical protein